MNTHPTSPNALHEPLSLLCEEVGLPMPSPDEQGVYVIDIDGQELRGSTLSNGNVVIRGIIGRADELAAQRKQSRQALLLACVNLQAVRFGKLGSTEVLSIEPTTDELILWQSFNGPEVSIPSFLQGTEALLNELEFWKKWLAHS